MHVRRKPELTAMANRSGSPAAGWIRPQVEALSAYAVEDAEGLIKLDAMENPYSWPDDFVESWLACIAAVQRYFMRLRGE